MRPSHAIGLALLLAVAAGAAITGRPPAPPAARPAADAQAVRKLRDAQVRVNLPGGGHGAGVCRKSSDGTVWVWTVAHVAAHATTFVPDPAGGPDRPAYLPLTVAHRTFTADDRPAGRTEYEAVVVRFDESIDAALLRLTAKHAPVGTLDFAPTAPALWTPVLTCGSPRGYDCTVTRGVVNYLDRRTPWGLMDQVDSPTLGGNSGGPVAGPDGRVVGLVSGGIGENFTCLVTARTLRKFAAEQNLLFAFEGDAPGPPPTGPVDVTPGP